MRSTLSILILTIAVELARLPTATAFIINPNVVPWTTTASGTRSANGEPVTLTWSFVPDGTTITGNLGSNLGGSNLISWLNTNFNGDANQSDLTQQPWFSFFNDSFDRWSQLSGATYVYEPNDDGGTNNNKSGVLGLRGDIRIGGASVDGASGTLAFNFLPESGSDMVLDTDDTAFFTNPAANHVRLRNTIMHEHGHGFGLQHVESDTDNLLMQPTLNTTFDGPQLDEVRGIQFYFGDAFEKTNGGLGNEAVGLAADLGPIPSGGMVSVGADANVPSQAISPTATDFVSISNVSDVDFYSFTVSEPTQLNALLTPRGGTFSQASEGQTPTPFDASARSDLALTIFDSDGTSILATENSTGQGGTESIFDLSLPTAGQYFARVTGADDTIQLYELDLSTVSKIFLAADFNTDGFVDDVDLGIWETSFGVDSGADADGDGDSDGNDFLLWQRQFGTTTISTLASVPEPATIVEALILGLLLSGGQALRRRFRR